LKRYFLIALIALLIAAPIGLLLLPADFFDSGQSICLSVVLLDKTCPGCGMTRAIQHLIHLDIREAVAYNRMSFVVLPAMIFVWFRELRKLWRKLRALPAR
jgi:hypothetical protein